MGAVVSTCSATSSPSPWLPWLLARLLCLCPLATSPDLSLDLLPLLPGGLHRLPTLVSLLTMWARGKLLSLSPGNIPGLVPGSEAARQWWTNQLLWAEQQAHHVKREAVEVPAGVS